MSLIELLFWIRKSQLAMFIFSCMRNKRYLLIRCRPDKRGLVATKKTAIFLLEFFRLDLEEFDKFSEICPTSYSVLYELHIFTMPPVISTVCVMDFIP